MTVKAPIDINYDDTVEAILKQLMTGIEQTSEFDTLENIKNQSAEEQRIDS